MNNSLKKITLRILEISYNNKLSHIGSCLTAAPIIYDIYNIKKYNDIFILSSGHAYLAQLVVMEHFGIIEDAEEIVLRDGMHPKRNLENEVYLSTGSLGMGLPVAVGVAMASPDKKVFCLLSDGEMAEGSIWESLHFMNNRVVKFGKGYDGGIKNLHIYLNSNGFSALGSVNAANLREQLDHFHSCKVKIYDMSMDHIFTFSFMKELKAHYQVLTKEQYGEVKNYYTNL